MYHDPETLPYQPTEQDERNYQEWLAYIEEGINRAESKLLCW